MATKGWGKSKVTRESLLPYVASGVIPEFNRERWRVPPADEWNPSHGPGVSDLGPHSVQQISLFVALCECYLACPPYFPLWVSIFHGRATRASKGGEALIPNGGITFQVKSGESFIDMALPKKAQSQRRRFWFYAKEYTPPARSASSVQPRAQHPAAPQRPVAAARAGGGGEGNAPAIRAEGQRLDGG
ncbi:hypothetical protein QYE76_032048 [Lolium multiflorum]|uniref:Transposase (putative) gypsy type domain-containing protein n=1 Tax=Lolium multiflorum TaxID=4521 RepID=A0AAD8VKS2_LOLMU|nr:hypothetical protein QYE76_032048 [Lolium multiflorum]